MDFHFNDCFQRLLVGLTSPIECLIFEETPNRREKSPHIMYELNQLLYNAKESFLDPRTTRALIDHIGRILENVFWSLRQHILFCSHYILPFFHLSNHYQQTAASLLTIHFYWFETSCTFQSAQLHRRSLKTMRLNVRNKIESYGTYLFKDSIGF
jgi:hypothetical protein